MLKQIGLTIVSVGNLLLPQLGLTQEPADLNDLQIAHVAYVADNIDIRYAHLAMALSSNEDVRSFANTMISDHNSVNDQALKLLAELNASPEDNFLSRTLLEGAEETIEKISRLRGHEFDLAYAENELAYHQAVVSLVRDSFIPNIELERVRVLFEAGLQIFEAHEEHAAHLVKSLR